MRDSGITKPVIDVRGCPFCGCERATTWHIGHYDKPWIVQCLGCSAEGPHADTEEEALKSWNKREAEE